VSQTDSGKEAIIDTSFEGTLQEPPANTNPTLYVLLLRQDDPRKCTAAKLAKFGFAQPLFRIRQIPRKAIVLNPSASRTLRSEDSVVATRNGLVAVDCSWEKVEEAFAIHIPGEARRLPTLLASNPVNYAKPEKLSSLEALTAALYIMGFKQRAIRLLGLFKWGKTFLTLNSEPLEAYATAVTPDDLEDAEAQFFRFE
jgi:pre-rRNA-processing protein TSR3